MKGMKKCSYPQNGGTEATKKGGTKTKGVSNQALKQMGRNLAKKANQK